MKTSKLVAICSWRGSKTCVRTQEKVTALRLGVRMVLPRVLWSVANPRHDTLSLLATKSVFRGDGKQVVWCMQGAGDYG
jgi:hypothetical protein